MPSPPVIAFTAVPLRARADGWTPELQLRFVLALADGLNPGEAAASVGENRQNAYALRKRAGAGSFAAAWDAAVAHARRARLERAAPPRSPPPPLTPERRALHEALRAIVRANSDNCDPRKRKNIFSMGSRNY